MAGKKFGKIPYSREYRLSNKAMTFGVTIRCRDSVIIEAAPIAKKFIGSKLYDLVGWMRKMNKGKVSCEMLSSSGTRTDGGGQS